MFHLNQIEFGAQGVSMPLIDMYVHYRLQITLTIS